MIGAVPALTVNAMLSGMNAVGLETEPIVRRSGLHAAELSNGLGRIPDPTYEAIWREARGASGCDAIGAIAGRAVPVGALGPLDYLSSSADTLEAGLLCLRDFAHLTTESAYWEIEKGPDGSLVARFTNVLECSEDDVGDEFAMALLLGRITNFATQPVPIQEVSLLRRRPSSEISRQFLGRASFGHSRSQIVFGPGAATMQPRPADASLHQILRTLLREAGKSKSSPWGTTVLVRGCSRELLRDQQLPSLTLVAGKLGVSERTLQRRLQGEGTRFDQVLDELRKELALDALRQSHGASILTLALELGFADDSAFARAFRRWTGMSPRSWRSSVHAPLSAPRHRMKT